MAKDLLYFNSNKQISIPKYRVCGPVTRIRVDNAVKEKCDIVTIAVFKLRKWAKSGYPKTCDDRFLYNALKGSTKRRLAFGQAGKVLKILKESTDERRF